VRCPIPPGPTTVCGCWRQSPTALSDISA
jgi:hypothetical protein